jgi:hypothetical protein
MSEDFQTAAPAVTQSPADSATEQAIESHISGAPPEQTEAAFNRASIAHRRSAPPAPDGTPGHGGWRDGNELTSLGPMPPAPTIASTEVDSAIAKLNNNGAESAALVAEWGQDFKDNFSFARAAFKDVAANNPDLIRQVEASGLGNSPAVLQFLAKQGRLSAGLMGIGQGDYSAQQVTARNEPLSINRTGPTGPTAQGPIGNNRGSEETRSELARMMREAPPGSALYKDPQIQARIQQLHRTISGSGPPVGVLGRRA